MKRNTRKAAAIIRSRRRVSQLAKTFGHRPRSLATYTLAACGMNRRTAEGCANSLRTVAKKLEIVGIPGITTRTIEGPAEGERPTTRYTKADVHKIATAYKPRKPEYRAARAALLALTAA
ncbi:hypothetical protein ACFC6U_39695 [Kitasatospora purpeofusca]|uniref:hypothetical protein n=1 Tax=Kitasatospora purpeofusca TaxID=67352 RepID=UPI0035DFF92D